MKLTPFLLCAATAVAAVLPANATPKKLLVVTVTTEFRHTSIASAEASLAKMAATSGEFTVDFVSQPPGQPKAPARPKPGAAGEADPAYPAALKNYESGLKPYQQALASWMGKVAEALQALSPQNLQKYDAVCFVHTTGDLPLPDKQGFLDWIAAGHAFIGVHAASDTFHGFPAYLAMVGGEFKTHGPQVSVDCINEDPAHAATSHLPATWTLFDEIYQFNRFARPTVHGLLRLDKHPNNHTPGDYPLSWCKPFGTGRVFYTALGHREDLWDQEFAQRSNAPELARQFNQHVLGGILWALGLAPGDATPQAVKP